MGLISGMCLDHSPHLDLQFGQMHSGNFWSIWKAGVGLPPPTTLKERELGVGVIGYKGIVRRLQCHMNLKSSGTRKG